ncbi:MAG: META domain-containing protein [Chloroflexales bacterium]|nr:META domain-containing protein [Chloroflexales bacterium]
MQSHYRRRFVAALVGILLAALGGCGLGQGAQGGASGAASTLAGTTWTLRGIEQGGGVLPLARGTPPTLQFGTDGTVSGTTGCNSFGGRYTVNGQALAISDVRQTLKACEPSLMEQETHYTTALSAAQSFTLDSTNLTITTADATLRLVRPGPSA